MGRDEIFEVESTWEQLADGMSVGIGGSQTTAEFSMTMRYNRVAVGFDIDSQTGSSSVELQMKIGTDVNGNDVWHTVGSAKTAATGYFDLDVPCKSVRLKVSETGGVSGLSGISVWAEARAL